MSNIIDEFEKTVSNLITGTDLFDQQSGIVESIKEDLKVLEKLKPERRAKVLIEAQKEAGVNVRADIDEISNHNADRLISMLFLPEVETQVFDAINIQDTKERESGIFLLADMNEVAKDQIELVLKEISINQNEPDLGEILKLISPKYPLDSWGEKSKNWIKWWEIQQYKLWFINKKWDDQGFSSNSVVTKTVPEQIISDYHKDPDVRMVVESLIDGSKIDIKNEADEKVFIAGKYKEILLRGRFITARNVAREILKDPNRPKSLYGDANNANKAAIERIVRVVGVYKKLLEVGKLPIKQK